MKFPINKILIFAFIFVLFLTVNKASADATVNFSANINGSITVSDDSNDASGGKDPTLNTSITLTPDLGATVAFGSSNFRVRTNLTMWQLGSQRSGFNAGTTGLDTTDVSLSVTKTAGSNANASSCALQGAFSGVTDLSEISTSSATPICTGSAITSSARDTANSTNYLRFQILYFLNQDFFFTPGTASDTITYTVISL